MNVSSFSRAIKPLLKTGLFATFVQRKINISFFGNTDPCPDVYGMASSKKLRLLNLAVSLLLSNQSECYCEIGTFQGKSLVGALMNNQLKCAIACDNFSEFDVMGSPQNQTILKKNLEKYGLAKQIQFFDCNFSRLFSDWKKLNLPPIGVYFYDGAHDEESQFQAIFLAEPFLAVEAIVIIDDWRFAQDSESYAKAGTLRAIGESKNQWLLLHELKAKYNGDRVLWWNGVGVLSFKRKTA